MNNKLQEFSKLVIKLVKTVHKELGPGFTESVYQGALAIELRRYKVNYLKEMSFEIFYRNQVAGTGRLDFFINDSKLPNVIIETMKFKKPIRLQIRANTGFVCQRIRGLAMRHAQCHDHQASK